MLTKKRMQTIRKPLMAVERPTLSLSVQYGMPVPMLPRWRLRRWVERAIACARSEGHDGFIRVQIGLRLVDAEEGQTLNRDFRGRDYATNVLTFEYGVDPEGIIQGDIVLCVPVWLCEANEQGKPPLDHAAHLIVHGVLHALGYDHIEADDAQRMETLETRILASMGLPDPYTLRPATDHKLQ